MHLSMNQGRNIYLSRTTMENGMNDMSCNTRDLDLFEAASHASLHESCRPGRERQLLSFAWIDRSISETDTMGIPAARRHFKTGLLTAG
jgi:hypothetical protein